MEPAHVVLAAIAIIVGYKAIKAISQGYREGDAAPFCTTCGHQGQSRTHTRGTLTIEVILWLCLLLPGLVYSTWRMSTRTQACAKCGGTALVPADSPVATKMRRDLTTL